LIEAKDFSTSDREEKQHTSCSPEKSMLQSQHNYSHHAAFDVKRLKEMLKICLLDPNGNFNKLAVAVFESCSLLP